MADGGRQEPSPQGCKTLPSLLWGHTSSIHLAYRSQGQSLSPYSDPLVSQSLGAGLTLVTQCRNGATKTEWLRGTIRVWGCPLHRGVCVHGES